MTASEVTDLLTALRDGSMSLDEVAQRFRERRWPRRKIPSRMYRAHSMRSRQRSIEASSRMTPTMCLLRRWPSRSGRRTDVRLNHPSHTDTEGFLRCVELIPLGT
jgi:hypothetical protein